MTGVGFIFARGGSKGVPRKNIRLLAGKPLIAHSIEVALASRYIDRVVVSTEDEEIAEVARKWGADIPFLRPMELAMDDSAEIYAWRHAIVSLYEEGEFDLDNDVFISVPCTSPLRNVHDVDACVAALHAAPSADVSLTICEAARHPSFNMVKRNVNGDFFELVMPPVVDVHRRQDADPVFDITTVCYAARPHFVMNNDALMRGRVVASIVPPERALDIDTLYDFKLAEFMLQNGGDL